MPSEHLSKEIDPITQDDLRNITARQVDALKRLRDDGALTWKSGGTAAASRFRMFVRMRDRGYVVGPPFNITEKGRKMVARFYD